MHLLVYSGISATLPWIVKCKGGSLLDLDKSHSPITKEVSKLVTRACKTKGIITQTFNFSSTARDFTMVSALYSL